MERPLPQTPDAWLDEIRLAFDDARETIPVAGMTGQRIGDADLFHLAPVVCLKFRGMNYRDEDLRSRVTEGALTTYIVNSDREDVQDALKSRPIVGFALCYIAAHVVLDLLDEQQADAVLCHCEEHLKEARPKRKRRR